MVSRSGRFHLIPPHGLEAIWREEEGLDQLFPLLQLILPRPRALDKVLGGGRDFEDSFSRTDTSEVRDRIFSIPHCRFHHILALGVGRKAATRFKPPEERVEIKK